MILYHLRVARNYLFYSLNFTNIFHLISDAGFLVPTINCYGQMSTPYVVFHLSPTHLCLVYLFHHYYGCIIPYHLADVLVLSRSLEATCVVKLSLSLMLWRVSCFTRNGIRDACAIGL